MNPPKLGEIYGMPGNFQTSMPSVISTKNLDFTLRVREILLTINN
jgi:hypothetical protein